MRFHLSKEGRLELERYLARSPATHYWEGLVAVGLGFKSVADRLRNRFGSRWDPSSVSGVVKEIEGAGLKVLAEGKAQLQQCLKWNPKTRWWEDLVCRTLGLGPIADALRTKFGARWSPLLLDAVAGATEQEVNRAKYPQVHGATRAADAAPPPAAGSAVPNTENSANAGDEKAASTVPGGPALKAVARACTTLLVDFDRFWLPAIITERGIEEGSRNRRFAESVRSFASAGFLPEACDELASGINGNLAEVIRKQDGEWVVSTNPSGGRDIILRPTGEGPPAAVEVKHVYDMTFAKYYQGVAEDAGKLLAFRGLHPGARLFQVVFFVQLPAADYPAGAWYGTPVKARRHWLVERRIEDQYRRVVKAIGKPATWPAEPPLSHRLNVADSTPVMDLLRRWVANVFTPDEPWTFEPSSYFKAAAVGVAIWEH